MQKSREAKVQIRNKYRKLRNQISKNSVTEWSEAICRRLTEWELFRQAEDILFYYPLGNEVNLLQAAQVALDTGKNIGFPRTEGDVIQFYQVEDLNDFQEGCFHVMEPLSETLFLPEKPLILTPGMAFDEQGNRMGYGRGYYDRYMAQVPQAVKIGVAYEMQIAEAVPIDEFDVPMDYIVTEQRLW